VLWVIGSVILLVFQPFEISNTGEVIIAGVALVVLLLALLQAKALAQIDKKGKGKIKQLSFERTVDAPKEMAWEVMADVAHYHEVAPNIDEVKIISGEGEGMLRACRQGEDRWTESCTAWVEGKEYAFEVNIGAPDYPYPFSFLKGHWKVEEMDDSRTKIIMCFAFKYEKSIYNYWVHPFLRRKFSKTAEELLDKWERKMGEQ
jgi:ribosome-associated toxin RatA of RatAB toxin-antitoxin module